MPATSRRRRPAELRQLLVDAAERVFSRQPYTSVTVESIATEAGVTRSVLYRHFPNKNALYQAVVVTPFAESIRAYAEVWRSQLPQPWDERTLMTAMASVFYDAFAAHRAAVLTIALQGADELDAVVRAALDGFFSEILAIGTKEIEHRPWIPAEGLDLSIRLVIGAIAAAAVLDPVILPAGTRQPSREDLISRLVDLTLYGLPLAPERRAGCSG
jgi:AcrR family transcriptional regulator